MTNTDTDSFINKLKKDLSDSINDTSHSFKENEYVKIKDGKLSISKLKKKPIPENKHKIDKLISEKLMPIGILDVLIDSNSWLNWTKHFGLLSGHETKLDDSIEKYILTTFCYGCNLGPTQTTRSIENLNRKNISWINKMHITEEKIVKATNHIINSYKHFELTKAWGVGETAAADGTMHDVYENNLFSENHIRYGGYGALGYNHVADNYIALFSNFIPCGVWEGVYILDMQMI